MLNQWATATIGEDTDRPLRILMYDQIHFKFFSNGINKLLTTLGGSFCFLYSQIQVMESIYYFFVIYGWGSNSVLVIVFIPTTYAVTTFGLLTAVLLHTGSKICSFLSCTQWLNVPFNMYFNTSTWSGLRKKSFSVLYIFYFYPPCIPELGVWLKHKKHPHESGSI